MPVKPKGVALAEFVAEGNTVRARYKSDHKEMDYNRLWPNHQASSSLNYTTKPAITRNGK